MRSSVRAIQALLRTEHGTCQIKVRSFIALLTCFVLLVSTVLLTYTLFRETPVRNFIKSI
jgi:hypothetical protein